MATPTLQNVLAANHRNAMRIVQDGGLKQMKKILSRAQADLERRLRETESLRGGGDFTSVKLRTTLAQIRQVSRQVQRGIKSVLLDQGKKASEGASDNVLTYLQKANKKFKGVAEQPLALREAAIVDVVTSGVNATILRRLASSGEPVEGAEEEPAPAKQGILERYGLETIGHFEDTLQSGLVAQTPWAEVRDQLVEGSPFLQQAPAYWAERIIRTECLVGETPVSGAVIRAAYRRWYEGDVVEIVTESGRHFTTTPNHPMLSRRAWIFSGSLQPGDDLVCYRGEENSSSARNRNVTGSPSTIAEIFDSLQTVGVFERRPTANPDFHGDGRQGEVDVAYPLRPLEIGKFAPIYKKLAQDIFAPSNFSSSSFCSLCGHLFPIQERICFCLASKLNSAGPKAICDSSIVDSELLTQLLTTFSSEISLGDIANIDVRTISRMAQYVEAILSGFGAGSDDPPFFQERFNLSGSDAQGGGNSVGAHPREIQFDRVCTIRFRHFAGHVYNLTTPHGYFSIDGVYTGNTMGIYNRAGWETIREVHEELGDMCKILAATFDERTASDSFAVHGQIRRPDEAFESWFGLYQHPPNRPNDREIVVPHRVSWEIPPYLSWKTNAQIAARWKFEGRKGKIPERPLMTTIPLSQFGK